MRQESQNTDLRHQDAVILKQACSSKESLLNPSNKAKPKLQVWIFGVCGLVAWVFFQELKKKPIFSTSHQIFHLKSSRTAAYINTVHAFY